MNGRLLSVSVQACAKDHNTRDFLGIDNAVPDRGSTLISLSEKAGCLDCVVACHSDFLLRTFCTSFEMHLRPFNTSIPSLPFYLLSALNP